MIARTSPSRMSWRRARRVMLLGTGPPGWRRRRRAYVYQHAPGRGNDQRLHGVRLAMTSRSNFAAGWVAVIAVAGAMAAVAPAQAGAGEGQGPATTPTVATTPATTTPPVTTTPVT